VIKYPKIWNLLALIITKHGECPSHATWNALEDDPLTLNLNNTYASLTPIGSTLNKSILINGLVIILES
jgi:hypothetical protein